MKIITAQSRSELRRAAELVYRQYELKRLIASTPRAVHQSQHTALGPAATFLAVDGGVDAGCFTVFSDGPQWGLPADVAYNAEMGALRAWGWRMVEVGELAGDGLGFIHLSELLARAFWYARHSGAKHIICEVNPAWSRLYETLMGFAVVGAERTVLNDQPAVLMAMPTEPGDKIPRWVRGWLANSLSEEEVGLQTSIMQSQP